MEKREINTELWSLEEATVIEYYQSALKNGAPTRAIAIDMAKRPCGDVEAATTIIEKWERVGHARPLYKE